MSEYYYHDIDEKTNKDLITRLLLITDSTINNIRTDTNKALVLTVLASYEPLFKFTIDEVKIRIFELTKCHLPIETITSIIEKLVEQNQIEHIKSGNYAIRRKIEIQNFSSVLEPIWLDFNESLHSSIPDYDEYIDKDTKKVFESIIFRILLEISESCDNLQFQIDMLQDINFEKIVNNYIDCSIITPVTAKQFPRVLSNLLFSKNQKVQTFFFRAYLSIIKYHIAIQEQSIPQINLQEKIRCLLLDTSFLVSLFCKTDSRNPLATAVVNHCIKLGIPLYYALISKEEMDNLIFSSNSYMSNINFSPSHSLIDNQFVSDFGNNIKTNKLLSWSEYHTILEKWPEQFKTEYNVLILPEQYEEDRDQAVSDYILETLEIISKQKKGKPQLIHDSQCIGIVSSLRRKFCKNSDASVLGPWFVTFDNFLSVVDGLFQKRFNLSGLVFQPRNLINYFLVYSRIEFDDTDKRSVGESIIKYCLGSYSNVIGIDEYSSLITYKMGLSNKDIETVKELILSHPLKEELKRALESGKGEIADETITRILSDSNWIDKVLENSDKKEQLKIVSKKLRETQGKLREKEIENNILMDLLPIMGEINTQKIYAIYGLLKSENLFENGIIKQIPEKKDTKTILDWLTGIKDTIELSETYFRTYGYIIPIVTNLLQSFH